MTTKEHALMIAIFTKNLQLIHALKTVLESRGVIEKDDLKAYDALTAANAREECTIDR